MSLRALYLLDDFDLLLGVDRHLSGVLLLFPCVLLPSVCIFRGSEPLDRCEYGVFLHNEPFNLLVGLLLVDLLGLGITSALLLLLVFILLLVNLRLLSLPLPIGDILLLQELLLSSEPAGGTPLDDLLVQGSLPAGEALIPILGPKLPLFPDLDELAPLLL